MIDVEEKIRNRSNVILNDFAADIATLEKGVVFLYCSWAPTFIQLNLLLETLESFSNITLYVFDIDHIEFKSYKNNNKEIVSNGWGETYWVKNGEVIAFEKNYPPGSQDLLFKHHRVLND